MRQLWLGTMLTALVMLGAACGGCGATKPATAPPPGDPATATLDAEAPPPPPERPLPADRAAIRDEYKSLALKNTCPDGYPRLQGRWKFVGETRTPEFSDTLEIRGTRLTERLSGLPDGQRVDATIDGEVRCLFKNRVLVMLSRVTPEGAFDNQSGDSYPCDVLDQMGGEGNRMLLVCYFDWDLRTAAGLEFEYERVAD